MSTRRWKGTAAAVSQISTLTPANVEVGDVFTVTCNGKSISYVAASPTVADVCNGLAIAIATSGQPEFKEFTAQNVMTAINLIGNTPGKPFTVSASTANGGAADTQTLTVATPTPATGPNDFANPNNWSGAAVPLSGDDVYFDSGSVDCLYGLAQSAVTLNSLNVLQAYTGKIGLPLQNAAGYYEYRPTELAIGATAVNVGQGGGNGSGRIKLDCGPAACTLNVYNTGQPAEPGIPALLWRGTSAGNAVNVNKGVVGLAFFPGDTATIADLRIGYVSNPQGDAQVSCGSGAAISTVTKNGGQVSMYGGATTVLHVAGQLTIWGAAGITTLTIEGGTVVYNSTGAIGTLHLAETGTIDFSQDQQAKTISSTVNRYGDNSRLLDPFKVIAALAIQLNQSTDLTNLEIGTNLTLTRS